jgi:hypothetical protein
LDDEEEDEDEEPKIPLSRVRHKARGSQDSHVSDSSVSTVTPHSHTPLAPRSGDSPKSQHSTPNPFTDRAAENPFRDQPPAKERLAPSTGRPLRYPTPKPLGLPLTGRRPPSPVRDMQNTLSSSDSLPPGGKTLDEEAETGRWWTDWLCGCREGPDRGGDHQVRPLPFEGIPRVEYLSGWENKPFRVNRTGLRSRTPFHSFRRGHDFPFIACYTSVLSVSDVPTRPLANCPRNRYAVRPQTLWSNSLLLLKDSEPRSKAGATPGPKTGRLTEDG